MTGHSTSGRLFDATEDFETAIEAAMIEIEKGRVVVIPTDTIYGIAAVAGDRAAVASIFAVKHRPPDRLVAVLVADLAQAASLVDTSGSFAILARRFWPGPVTLVGRRVDGSPAAVGDSESIGVRCPDNRVVGELARRAGPLAATSANIHGESPVSQASTLALKFPSIGVVIDAGPCSGEPSTVVDVRGPTPVVLRHGAVSEKEIGEALEATS